MTVLVLEGQGGAAKTPVCHKVAALLGGTYVHAFHEVSQALGHDVYDLWSQEPERALALLQPRLRPRNGLVVFDRGWLTCCRGLEEYGHQHLLPRVLADRPWTAFLDQDETYVRQRSTRLAQGLPPWDLSEDFVARRRWSERCDWTHHLRGEADLDALARAIAQAFRSSRA